MFTKLFTILFIIPAIFAKIKIDVSLSNENERVHMSGSSVSRIGEKEMAAFGLNDKIMKNAIAKTLASPDNVFLNSPTPWGDLYETMNWEPTKMIFTPRKAAILSAKNEQVLVKSKELHNAASERKSLKVDMRQLVKDIVSSKWSNENALEVDDIEYNFDMKMLATPFSFLSKGGDDYEKTTPLTLGGFIDVALEPKQNLVVELHGNAQVLLLRVDYESSLFGTVAMNFNKHYEGHRFWSMDIQTLQTTGGLKKVVHSSEIIEIVNFTDATVFVKDLDTGKVITKLPLNMF